MPSMLSTFLIFLVHSWHSGSVVLRQAGTWTGQHALQVSFAQATHHRTLSVGWLHISQVFTVFSSLSLANHYKAVVPS